MKKILRSFGIAILVIGICFPGSIRAKEKSPPQYQTAKLKEIKESNEPQTVYRQVTQKNGTTLNLPQTEYQKVYLFKIELGGQLLVGKWTPAFSFKRAPDWTVGQDIEVRIQKDHLWLKKPDGKELKTKIVERSQLSNTSVPR